MTGTHTGMRWELAAAAGAAWWVDKLVTVEWSYPYCGVLDDGEAAAVLGFPLPYQQAVIAASATYSFIPWLYALDLAAVAGLLLLLLRPLASGLSVWGRRRGRIIAAAAAALLLVTAAAFEVLVISMGVWRPVSSFSGTPGYGELRPVAVRLLEQPRNCTASPFWFPGRGARSGVSGERSDVGHAGPAVDPWRT